MCICVQMRVKNYIEPASNDAFKLEPASNDAFKLLPEKEKHAFLYGCSQMVERQQQRLRYSWPVREYMQLDKQSRALSLDSNGLYLGETADKVYPQRKFLKVAIMPLMKLWQKMMN